MAKIRIDEIPGEADISWEEMRAILGGIYLPKYGQIASECIRAYEIGGAEHTDTWSGEA